MDNFDRLALLSTGARVPLLAAAVILGQLDRLLDGTPEDRALVVKLRQACLTDSPPTQPDRASLVGLDFATDDGVIDAEVKEVVKACLRGAGMGVRMTSPFVSPWDQTLSNLVLSHLSVRGALAEAEADAVIAEADAIAGSGSHRSPGPEPSWLARVLKRRGDGGLPSPGAN